MLEKAKLGTRYTCYKCGTKFYDLNRQVPSCPGPVGGSPCGADQREAPARDIRALLGSKGPIRKYSDDDDEVDTAEGAEEDEDGFLGGLDDDDDDDVDMGEDEELGDEESGGGGGGGEDED